MASRDLMPSRGSGFEPSGIFGELQREVNQLFESLPRAWASLSQEPIRASGAFIPRVDVRETDDAVHIDAELPGMTDKDVELTLSPESDELIVRGEKRMEHEEGERSKGDYRVERVWGSFQRTIPLPARVDPNKVAAKFENGVLCIDLPKEAEAKRSQKRIQIKGSSEPKS